MRSEDGCDLEVWKKGEVVALTGGLAKAELEALAQELRLATGEPRVDWNYFAGRGVVKVLGDGQKVREALAEMAKTRWKARGKGKLTVIGPGVRI